MGKLSGQGQHSCHPGPIIVRARTPFHGIIVCANNQNIFRSIDAAYFRFDVFAGCSGDVEWLFADIISGRFEFSANVFGREQEFVVVKEIAFSYLQAARVDMGVEFLFQVTYFVGRSWQDSLITAPRHPNHSVPSSCTHNDQRSHHDDPP